MIGQPPRSTPLPHPTLSRSISVTISHDATTPQVVTDTATITDPAVVATGGNSYTVQEGSATLTNVVGASFTTPDEHTPELPPHLNLSCRPLLGTKHNPCPTV